MTNKKIKQELKDVLKVSETFEDFFRDGLIQIGNYRETKTGAKLSEMFYEETKKFARGIWDKHIEAKMPF